MTDSYEMEQAEKVSKEWADALARLSEDDRRLLTLLRVHGETVDPRYEMKGIRLLVGRSLVDPAFRAKALADADAALDELRGHIELPEGVSIRCVENTEDTLTIVLPPLPEKMDEKSRRIRDMIFSRTAPDLVTLGVSADDDDASPLHLPDPFSGDSDTFHFGDRSDDGH